MDIDLLSRMLKELVSDHDRVSLPGLGVFVAETVPSVFSDKGYTINPPYRRLSFRPGEENDRLLVSLYASANGVGEDVAASVLGEFISGMKEVLETRKNVVFPGLGRLRATRENNYFFVADEDLDIYPEGFALEPVSLKTHIETKEEVSAAMDALKVMIETSQAGEDTEEPFCPEPEASMKTADAAESDSVAPCDDSDRKKIPVWKKTAVVLLLAVLAFFLLYMVVSRVCPGFMDRILYDNDELDILRMIA